MNINALLTVPYRPYGRGLEGCDCWGLVRLVREDLRGDLLPSFGAVSPTAKRELTEAATSVIARQGFAPVHTPAPGAIATVWRAGLCHHVGVVVQADGRLAVLETGSRIGPRWLLVEDFQRLYTDVRFYDN